MMNMDELPIFPLPDAVLIPGGVLPLHVFEPRYREMTRDCLAGEKTLAIALLQPGFEATYQGRPPVHPMCGVGTILASDELPDGRFHLLLRGVARVRITEELAPRRAYREVRAVLVDDTQTARPEAVAAAHQQLLALCDRLSMAFESGGDQLSELVRAQTDPGGCADLVAAALMTGAAARQAMLECLDVADRVDTAIELIARLLAEMSGGAPN
jgi:Lon protease-like protein